MKIQPALLLPLLMIGCSCQRTPDDATSAADTTPATRTPPTPQAEPSAEQLAAAAQRAAHARALADAASTVHAYLGALPNSDRTTSDAFWSGGRPAPRPDDANLREITGGLRSMRVENDRPHALDQEQPPRAVEVPVRLRISTEAGTQRYSGWYRLRAKVGGDGWELTSASLQPELR